MTAKNLGTVAVGQEVALGGYNVSNVVIKDSTGTPVVVDASKYKVDAAFGTVTLSDVNWSNYAINCGLYRRCSFSYCNQ